MERDAEKRKQEWESRPKKDFSLKEGQTIQINIGSKNPTSKPKTTTTSGDPFFIPPPPSTSKTQQFQPPPQQQQQQQQQFQFQQQFQQQPPQQQQQQSLDWGDFNDFQNSRFFFFTFILVYSFFSNLAIQLQMVGHLSASQYFFLHFYFVKK